MPHPIDPFARMKELKATFDAKVNEYQTSLRKEKADGLSQPGPSSREVARELVRLNDLMHAELRRLEDELNLPEESLLEIERQLEPPMEHRWSRREVEAVSPTGFIDDTVAVGLERLLSVWIRDGLILGLNQRRSFGSPISAHLRYTL